MQNSWEPLELDKYEKSYSDPIEDDKAWTLIIHGLIKNKEDKILVLKNSPKSKYNPSLWDLPGGEIECDETFEDSLKKDIYNETKLEINIKKHIGSIEEEKDDNNIINLVILASPLNENVEVDKKYINYKWADLKRLKHLQLSPWLDKFLKKELK